MVKKIFTLPVFSILVIALVGAMAIAADLYMPLWSNGSETMTIAKGQSATFLVDYGSRNPPLTYSVMLYNDVTNSYVSTVKTGSYSGMAFTDTVVVTPANYNNLGGRYYMRITVDDTEGIRHQSDVLTLIVTDLAPVISNIPDVAMTQEPYVAFDLDDYVTDADDALNTLTWTVSGNSNVTVSIDANHVVTITPIAGFVGTNVLNFTVTDPSGMSASDLVTVTVSAGSSSSGTSAEKEVTIRDLNLQSIEGNMLMIRNLGSNIDDMRIKLTLEAGNSVDQIFNLNLEKNRVLYKALDFGDLEAGTYLAKVEVDGADDFEKKTYMLIDLN